MYTHYISCFFFNVSQDPIIVDIEAQIVAKDWWSQWLKLSLTAENIHFHIQKTMRTVYCACVSIGWIRCALILAAIQTSICATPSDIKIQDAQREINFGFNLFRNFPPNLDPIKKRTKDATKTAVKSKIKSKWIIPAPNPAATLETLTENANAHILRLQNNASQNKWQKKNTRIQEKIFVRIDEIRYISVFFFLLQIHRIEE